MTASHVFILIKIFYTRLYLCQEGRIPDGLTKDILPDSELNTQNFVTMEEFHMLFY